MQKISSYLYPNRITVAVDLASYLTEWKIVYQRRIKLYQGVNNVVEFDFKNTQQRRVDISGYTIKCIIFDQNDIEISTVSVVPSSNTGLATMSILANDIDALTPQFLRYAVYIDSGNGVFRPVYVDTQFGLSGTMELLKGIVPSSGRRITIDTFLYAFDDSTLPVVTKRYYSEAAEVKPLNDTGISNTLELAFELSALDGEIQVQISNKDVVNNSTSWDTIETFSVTSSTSTISKSYAEGVDYQISPTWLRIKYIPTAGNTGTVDKVTVIV